MCPRHSPPTPVTRFRSCYTCPPSLTSRYLCAAGAPWQVHPGYHNLLPAATRQPVSVDSTAETRRSDSIKHMRTSCFAAIQFFSSAKFDAETRNWFIRPVRFRPAPFMAPPAFGLAFPLSAGACVAPAASLAAVWAGVGCNSPIANPGCQLRCSPSDLCDLGAVGMPVC